MHRSPAFAAFAAVALLVLAGCADPGARFATSPTEPGPPGGAGPFGGDGTVHLVVVYFSFEIQGEGHLHGDMGGHCGFDDWTLDPPSARMDVPSDASLPTEVVMREIHPDEDDLDRVSHFGTAPVAGWDGHWNDATIHAAFDREQALGAVAWDDGRPHFAGVAIPSSHWLVVEQEYTVDADEGPVTVAETLHLRDLGEVPVAFDRSDPLCM